MNSTATSLPRPLRLALIAAIAIFCCGLALSGGLLYLHYHTPAAPTPAPGVVDTIPPFNLVDQDNTPVTRDIFQGRITILQFMFTSCPLACPAMTNQMQMLQKRLRGVGAPGGGVQFVSMSFDPAHDTPAVLKAYASQRFKVDESNWRFLTEPTGSTANTPRSIYAHDLHQNIEDVPGASIKSPDGSDMPNINHTLNLFLIAPDNTVIGIYNSNRPNEMNDLVTHALLAVKQLK